MRQQKKWHGHLKVEQCVARRAHTLSIVLQDAEYVHGVEYAKRCVLSNHAQQARVSVVLLMQVLALLLFIGSLVMQQYEPLSEQLKQGLQLLPLFCYALPRCLLYLGPFSLLQLSLSPTP